MGWGQEPFSQKDNSHFVRSLYVHWSLCGVKNGAPLIKKDKLNLLDR